MWSLCWTRRHKPRGSGPGREGSHVTPRTRQHIGSVPRHTAGSPAWMQQVA